MLIHEFKESVNYAGWCFPAVKSTDKKRHCGVGVMEIVVALVVIIFVTLGYILFSPISIHLGFTFDHGFSGFVRVRLFPFEYDSSRDTVQNAARTKSVETRHKKSGIEKGRKALNAVVELLRVSVDESETLHKVALDLVRLIKGILKSTDQHYLKLSMAGGLGPPDLTGHLYGTILSVQPLLGSSVSLAYRPDYLADHMSGEVVAGAMVRAYRLLSDMLIFAWRVPKVKIIRLYFILKKGG